MVGIRRAFLLASLGRYLITVVNLMATLTMARLLAPADFGVAVLGGSALGLAEALRALGGGAYLVQQQDLEPRQIRANFTISLIVTIVLIAALLLATRPLALILGRPELESYLRVATLGFLAGPITHQISALMSRSLAFGQVALITTVSAAVNAAIGIGLALLGLSYMSLAWASAISALVAMALYLRFWRDWSIFRLDLREWRSVLRFGIHDSAFGIISQVGEAVPYLIIGRVLDASSVGLLQRAVLLAFFPERVILAGVGAVALPAFSKLVREGREPKTAYLKVLRLMTGAQWPALVILIVLADPLVRILLGLQWHGMVPLLQLFAGALLFSFPIPLQYPTLVALGGIRTVPIIFLVQVVTTIGLLAFAAPSGLKAIAFSAFAIIPFCGLLSLTVVRNFLKFGWFELVAAIAPSAGVTLICVTGPILAMMAAGWPQNPSIPLAVLAAALGCIGWVVGLRLTDHSLLQEMLQFGVKLKSEIEIKLARKP